MSIIKFEKTNVNLSGLSTKTTPELKIQETPTVLIIRCLIEKSIYVKNCSPHEAGLKETKIEFNKRFGMPVFIPLIALVCCFLLSSRKERKNYGSLKYLCGFVGLSILVSAEITVRYSGISWYHTAIYYSIPVGLLPLVYLYLIKTFKHENLD